MSDVYGAGIDQAKLFQTISLAVADATKEVLEGEQANRIRELEAEVARLQLVIEPPEGHDKLHHWAMQTAAYMNEAGTYLPLYNAARGKQIAESKLRAVEGYVDGLDGLPGSKMWRIWQDIKTLLEVRCERQMPDL